MSQSQRLRWEILGFILEFYLLQTALCHPCAESIWTHKHSSRTPLLTCVPNSPSLQCGAGMGNRSGFRRGWTVSGLVPGWSPGRRPPQRVLTWFSCLHERCLQLGHFSACFLPAAFGVSSVPFTVSSVLSARAGSISVLGIKDARCVTVASWGTCMMHTFPLTEWPV